MGGPKLTGVPLLSKAEALNIADGLIGEVKRNSDDNRWIYSHRPTGEGTRRVRYFDTKQGADLDRKFDYWCCAIKLAFPNVSKETLLSLFYQGDIEFGDAWRIVEQGGLE